MTGVKFRGRVRCPCISAVTYCCFIPNRKGSISQCLSPLGARSCISSSIVVDSRWESVVGRTLLTVRVWSQSAHFNIGHLPASPKYRKMRLVRSAESPGCTRRVASEAAKIVDQHNKHFPDTRLGLRRNTGCVHHEF